jgi:hypothetical protein
MSSEEDAPIAETATKAKQLLFDKDGSPKGNRHFMALLAMHLLCKPVQQFGSGPADYNFCWCDAWFGYDPKAGEILIQGARSGDYTSDGMLCCAAAMILDATGEIANTKLRSYAVGRLSGDISPPKENRKYKNAYRDAVIAGWLIRPLVLEGFSPTRNEATEGESACSIVSQALKGIRVDLSERRLAEIWAEAAKRSPNITKN